MRLCAQVCIFLDIPFQCPRFVWCSQLYSIILQDLTNFVILHDMCDHCLLWLNNKLRVLCFTFMALDLLVNEEKLVVHILLMEKIYIYCRGSVLKSVFADTPFQCLRLLSYLCPESVSMLHLYKSALKIIKSLLPFLTGWS